MDEDTYAVSPYKYLGRDSSFSYEDKCLDSIHPHDTRCRSIGSVEIGWSGFINTHYWCILVIE